MRPINISIKKCRKSIKVFVMCRIVCNKLKPASTEDKPAIEEPVKKKQK